MDQDWVFIFCDGACRGNGTPLASASYACVLVHESRIHGGKIDADCVFSGKVSPFEYDYDGGELKVSNRGKTPTNNRGELIAIIQSMIMAKQYNCMVEIVTDSMISIDLITKFYPARLARGEHRQLANLDLLTIAFNLMTTNIKLTHIHAHTVLPNTVIDLDDFFKWGNAHADMLAAEANKLRITISPPHN